MRKIIDPFTDYLPHLDLHGETTATIVYLIEAFIRDNVKLKNDKINTQKGANTVHYEVGKEIRNTIEKLGGTMPENLPTPEKSLKELERENKECFNEIIKIEK